MVIFFNGCTFRLGHSGKYFLLQRVLSALFMVTLHSLTIILSFVFITDIWGRVYLCRTLQFSMFTSAYIVKSDHYQEILVFDILFVESRIKYKTLWSYEQLPLETLPQAALSVLQFYYR